MNQRNKNAFIFNVILSKNMNTLCVLFKVFLRQWLHTYANYNENLFFPGPVAMYITTMLSSFYGK